VPVLMKFLPGEHSSSARRSLLVVDTGGHDHYRRCLFQPSWCFPANLVHFGSLRHTATVLSIPARTLVVPRRRGEGCAMHSLVEMLLGQGHLPIILASFRSISNPVTGRMSRRNYFKDISRRRSRSSFFSIFARLDIVLSLSTRCRTNTLPSTLRSRRVYFEQVEISGEGILTNNSHPAQRWPRFRCRY